jgi:hypothetical protein
MQRRSLSEQTAQAALASRKALWKALGRNREETGSNTVLLV